MSNRRGLTQLQIDLLYLMACALNDVTPDALRVEDADIKAMHRLACRHSVDALVASALLAYWSSSEAVGHAVSDEVLIPWIRSEAEAQRREILFTAERTKIMDGLDEQSIWHMPLKGAIIKDFYPRQGLRQMCDIDILFDASYQVYVREWLETCGYDRRDKGFTHHEAFAKEPIYNVEMHNRLFDFEPWLSYYQDVKERLVPVEKTRCRFAFKPEDNYIYVIAHAAKHYLSSGTGMRSLADVLVCLRAYGDELDLEYIEQECKKLDLVDFERTMRSLSQKVLGTENRLVYENLDDNEQEMLSVMVGGGTYGSLRSRVRIQTRSGTRAERAAYIRSRLFPPLASLKMYYPVLEKYPVLLPGFYVFRATRALVVGKKRRNAFTEVRALKELEDE